MAFYKLNILLQGRVRVLVRGSACAPGWLQLKRLKNHECSWAQPRRILQKLPWNVCHEIRIPCALSVGFKQSSLCHNSIH